MARIRTIKPDYYTSLSTADLSMPAFAMFPGLLTHCDDEGRFVDEPRLVKAALFPLRDEITAADVDSFLDEYVRADMLIRYEVDGRRFCQVTNFNDHQSVSKPRPSRHPAPSDGTVRDDSGNAPGGLPEGSPWEGNGREREGKGLADASAPAVDVGLDEPLPVKGPDLDVQLTAWAERNGMERPEDRRPLPTYRWLLGLVDELLGSATHSHGARMTLLGEWMVRSGAPPPTSEVWGHLARLVSAYGGLPTLDAMHEATTNGAGLDEQWKDDPRALTKYATSVLKNREAA